MVDLRQLLRRLWKHKKAIVLWGSGSLFLLAGSILLWASTLKIPDLSSIENRKIEQSVKIYDRTGTVLLYDLNQNTQRTVIPLNQISPDIAHATIAIEDPTFYQNPGVVWTALLRAVLVDLTSLDKTQGGSTLTQQVVKLTVLTGQKDYARKLKEIILAFKLSKTLSKDQILEIYLNQAPYGGAIYGVEEASQRYFGVPASQTTLPEAAYLAAIIRAPTYYSPYGTHRTELDSRKNLVLDKMLEHGFITQTQYDDAKRVVVVFQQQRDSSIQAPHFVFYVEQYLSQKYGEDALQQNSWKVISTLDADLQVHAEKTVQKWSPQMQKNFNASNEGMIALDPQTGQILAMVGSRNYFDTTIDGNYNITLSPRQPGSTFKPFAYAVAFGKGFTPSTVLFDIPTQFSTKCAPEDVLDDALPSEKAKGCYAPVDFDNKWRGPMTLRDALAQSINVPSVEVLYLAGVSDTLKLAKAMGITTLGSANQYGLTLVLGGGEVSLLQMTSAYGAFATDGTHYPTTPILTITDPSGKVIENNSTAEGSLVLQPKITEQINDVLSDNAARTPEFGAHSALYFPGREVAVKTGTTNDFRDVWVIGYTPTLVVGSWAGNNDNTPMTKNIAGFIVAPMWNEFMQYALSKYPSGPFVRSDIPSPVALKPVMRGVWQGGDSTVVNGIEQVQCNVHNILYWVDKNNPFGPSPREQSSDSQFPYWETALQRFIGNSACSPGSAVTVGPYSPPALIPQATDTAPFSTE